MNKLFLKTPYLSKSSFYFKKTLLAFLLCVTSVAFSQTFDVDGLSYEVNTSEPTTVINKSII